MEFDEGEFSVKVILLLEQAVKLPKEELFTERLTNGLKLTYFVELIGKLGLFLEDGCMFFSILLDEIADSFLQFSHLNVGKVGIRIED